jgi:predicted acyltransferase
MANSFAADDKPVRLVSLDAYRGFIMLAMASSGFAFSAIARQLEKSPELLESTRPHMPLSWWQALGYQFDHVTWTGCAFWDLIQPSFMFMVGVAIPYSFAARQAKGDSNGRIFFHVILRSIVLVLLGIFLSSNWSKQTDFTFVNVLTQIGLGYTLVFLLMGRPLLVQLLAIAVILAGYWYLFYQYPVPEPGVIYAAVGPKGGGLEPFTGLFAHWNMNTNFAWRFDTWFLNLFPREKPFEFNPGGYATLNFVPSMATMIFGLMAGELLRSGQKPYAKLAWLLVASAICFAVGVWADQNICPSVKRIWTPSWAVFSAGWTFALLAAFYCFVDILGFRRTVFPLVVVGMNSIAIYCMYQLLKPWIKRTLQIHISPDLFSNPVFGRFWEDVAVLAVLWLACYWMYRQRLFVKI